MRIDIAPLLTEVGGALRVSAHQDLIAVAGFDALTSVGSLEITLNRSLVDLSGLARVRQVELDISLAVLDDLQDLDALSALEHVGRSVSLSGVGLRNVDGLAGLTSLESLSIQVARSLSSIDGLSNLTAVAGDFVLFNTALSSLDALSSLESVGGTLYIRFAANLEDVDGLANLDAVGEDLIVGFKPSPVEVRVRALPVT